MTKEYIADLAIDMQRQRRKIELWMTNEALTGHLVQAGDYPDYQRYKTACFAFQNALLKYVDTECTGKVSVEQEARVIAQQHWQDGNAIADLVLMLSRRRTLEEVIAKIRELETCDQHI